MNEQLPLYGDHLLAARGLTVIEGAKQGPDVPEDFDPASLKPTDFTKKGESPNITGQEMQQRAEKMGAKYGRKLLWWYLSHQDQIPEEFGRVACTLFAGDYDLVDHFGSQCVLYLFRQSDTGWDWGYHPFRIEFWSGYEWIPAPDNT